ncbi:MAG TPA: hypothetical protein VMG31_04085 [Verrucomicrobiae bacterium]|nr:hypothetical protein [Verrucomicrobiae bacterium]
MTEPLRPMSTGELLDRTFALYRKNFILFVGIAALGPAAYLVFQLLTIGSAAVPGRTAAVGAAAAITSLGAGLFVGIVVMLAGMAYSQAATVKAVAAVHLGREITIGGAYKALRGRLWRVLGVFLLMIVLVGLGVVVIVVIAGVLGSLAVVGGASAGTGGAIAGGLVGVAVVVLGALLAIAVYVRYSLAIQACVVEDLRPIASLKRSASLSKGARSRVLAIYFVFGVLSMIVSLVLGGLAGAAGVALHNTMLALIVVYVTSFVAGSLTGPLGTIGISLLYYDERVRKEAFDLQLMMLSLDAPEVTAPVQV